MSNESFGFGIGSLIATPYGGGSPIAFGALQEVSLDIKGSTKKLTGQYQLPLAQARGEIDVTGKFKSGNIKAALFNSIFFSGDTVATGQTLYTSFAGTVPASSPYTLTPTIPGSGTWNADMGVFYAATGVQLTQVATPTAAGQYSVSSGTYTFYSADEGKAIVGQLAYTQTSQGSNSIITNQLMGTQPVFQLDLYQNNPAYAAGQWSVRLYACIADSITLSLKNNDWTMPEGSFSCFCNAANQLGVVNNTE